VSAQLSIEEQQLVEARVANERRSVGLAYVLWFFLGLLGIHNFYLGRTLLALFQLFAGVAAAIILVSAGAQHRPGLFGFGIALGAVWALSFVADLFLIPSRARRYSERVRARAAEEIASAPARRG
jgi:hypothetical protein